MDTAAAMTAPRVSVSRRGAAWAIDFLVVLVPSLALIVAAVTSLVHALPGYLGEVAAEVGWSRLATVVLHHGEGGSIGHAAAEEWTSFVQPLVWALLAVPVIQFGYHGICLAWRGRTLGAIAMGVRVGAAGDPTGLVRARALRRAFLTALIESGFLCLALAVVTIGQVSIGGVLIAAAVGAFWVNKLVFFGPRRRTLVDRVAGTVVVRSARFGKDIAINPAVPATLAPVWGTPVWGTPTSVTPSEGPLDLTAGQSTVALPSAEWPTGQSAAVGPAAVGPGAIGPSAIGPSAIGPSAVGRAGQAAADAAAVAGQLARESAESIARSEKVQQALNSAAGQRAQELGARATGSARRVGSRAQEMWNERQRRRQPPTP